MNPNLWKWYWTHLQVIYNFLFLQATYKFNKIHWIFLIIILKQSLSGWCVYIFLYYFFCKFKTGTLDNWHAHRYIEHITHNNCINRRKPSTWIQTNFIPRARKYPRRVISWSNGLMAPHKQQVKLTLTKS